MQCSQPFFVAGPPSCLQFYPCSTPPPQIPTFPQTCQTCNAQSYNGPVSNVVGEGDVTYMVLPDGTVQLFFIPATTPRCGRCLQSPNASPCWNNANTGGPWFIRSVNPHSDRLPQQQWLPPQPYGNYNYRYQNVLPPYPENDRAVKFHNDRCTSTEDIGYFCRAIQQKHEAHFPPKYSPSVQSRPENCCSRAVCDAPCKCPSNCAGNPPIFKGVLSPSDSDMSEDYEPRRGEKRSKSPYSYCSSCERNRKRRKYQTSSDTDSSDLSAKEWREERKKQKETYSRQRKERARARKEREKEKKERDKRRKQREREEKQREKERQKREKEYKKFVKESEKREKDSEKEEKRRREIEIKKKEKLDKELNKQNQDRGNERRKQIHLGDSQTDNRQKDNTQNRYMNELRTGTPDNTRSCNCGSKCLLGKLSPAVSSVSSGSATSFLSSSSSTNPCGVKYPKLYEKECQKLFDKELKRREIVRIKSEKSLEKMRKAEQKRSEKELNKREQICKKIEAEIQKKNKSAEKLREKEERKRKQGRIKQKKGMRKAEEKRPKVQAMYNNEGGKNKIGDTSTFNVNKDNYNGLENRLPGCPCYSSNSSIAKKKKEKGKKRSSECSCTTSLISEDKGLNSNTEHFLNVVDIADHPCLGCDNYCNKARASGKSSITHMKQTDKYNVDEVLKSVLCQPCKYDAPENARKECGVLCEGPTTTNKQVATHTDQANSGIFSNILKRLGVSVQCSDCSTPPDAAGPSSPGGSQLSFEFVSCGNDGNLTVCAKTDPSCHPL